MKIIQSYLSAYRQGIELQTYNIRQMRFIICIVTNFSRHPEIHHFLIEQDTFITTVKEYCPILVSDFTELLHKKEGNEITFI